jgi:hypothetical protein
MAVILTFRSIKNYLLLSKCGSVDAEVVISSCEHVSKTENKYNPMMPSEMQEINIKINLRICFTYVPRHSDRACVLG